MATVIDPPIFEVVVTIENSRLVRSCFCSRRTSSATSAIIARTKSRKALAQNPTANIPMMVGMVSANL